MGPAWGVVATSKDLSRNIHPKSVDRVRAASVSTRAIVSPDKIDFRILSGDAIRWISARRKCNDADIRHNVMRGIFLDATGCKQAEEANRLLTGETSHRVKNLLLVTPNWPGSLRVLRRQPWICCRISRRG